MIASIFRVESILLVHLPKVFAGYSARILLFWGAILLASCSSLRNYNDPYGPKFEGSYAGERSEFDGELRVVTWNISFAEEIEQAIVELKATEELDGADFLLLQEMDQEGTEAIARELGYNYVYYPATIHRNDRDFGNAVLSRWPIVDSEKLILPHRSPANNQIRIAACALTSVDGEELPVCSAHTETISQRGSKREDQIRFLTESIDPKYTYAIVGGDFNTTTPGSKETLIELFEQADLEWATEGAQGSYEVGPFGLALDYIFARELSAIDSGVAAETEASDHLPVWAVLQLAE